MYFHFKSENQLEFGYSGLGFESVEIQSLGNAAYVHVACQKVLGSNSSQLDPGIFHTDLFLTLTAKHHDTNFSCFSCTV